MIKQISVFLENRKGRLHMVTELLGQKGVDLIALSIADTKDFGILRFIVNKTDEAIQILRGAGYTANVTEVMAVKVQDKPGGLAKVLEALDKANISIEYLYSFVRTPHDSALIMFKVEDVAKAEKEITALGMEILTEEELRLL